MSDFGNGNYPVFEYAKNYNEGGFTDWYIPAFEEINNIWVIQEAITNALGKVNGMELTNYDYWTSNQADDHHVFSVKLTSNTPGTVVKTGPATRIYARCVRIFNDVEELLWDASEIGENVPGATDYPVIGISSVADLVQLATWVNNADNESQVLKGITFKMTDDIELNESFNAPIGMGWGDFNGNSDNGTPHKSFWGIFDGNGHTISKFTTDYFTTTPQTPYPALFGNVAGTVKNLTLEGELSSCGGIVGSLWGEVRNCVNKVNIDKDDNNCAGIVADARTHARIVSCVNYGTITTSWSTAGGIVADANYNSDVIIDSCINKGKITGKNHIGGIAGSVGGITIRNCVNTAEVEVLSSYLDAASGGGIAGSFDGNSGKIENCYNSGNISGKNGVGGILGLLENNCKINISNCYNRGGISASEDGLKGAIVGSVGEGADITKVGGNFFVVFIDNENTGDINIHGIGGSTEESGNTPFEAGDDNWENVRKQLHQWADNTNDPGNIIYSGWKMKDGYPALDFEK